MNASASETHTFTAFGFAVSGYVSLSPRLRHAEICLLGAHVRQTDACSSLVAGIIFWNNTRFIQYQKKSAYERAQYALLAVWHVSKRLLDMLRICCCYAKSTSLAGKTVWVVGASSGIGVSLRGASSVIGRAFLRRTRVWLEPGIIELHCTTPRALPSMGRDLNEMLCRYMHSFQV